MIKTLFILFVIMNTSLTHNWDKLIDSPDIKKIEVGEVITESDMIELLSRVENFKKSESNGLVTNVKPTGVVREKFAEKFLKEEQPSKALENMNKYFIEKFDDSSAEIQNVNPGLNMILSYDAILKIIKCYMPIIVTSICSSPLDVNFVFDFLTINKIYVIPKNFDETTIQVQPDPTNNSINIVFPTIFFEMIMNTDFNMITKFSGNVKAEVWIKDLVVSLQFYEEPEKDLNLESFLM